ncbi:LysR family transcriptional regulator [Alicyclobacillaceae bacterium I2511]|nr:LysR family transcriptional regulator [Alicyclobacillaceae bacterium I2511]
MDHTLQVFVIVVEERSFSKAAERLHLTQPAVTQQIRHLEDRLGAQLVERGHRVFRLTQAGELVYDHAQQILSLYGRMERWVHEMMQEAKGRIHVGASYTYGEYLLPMRIASFRQRYPLVDLEVFIGNSRAVLEGVKRGAIELGIVEIPVFDATDVEIQPLSEDILRVILSSSHPLTTRSHVSTKDLAKETWLVREAGSGTRNMTDELFTRLKLVPRGVVVFGSTQGIKAGVEAGMGISLLSECTFQKELSLQTIKTLEFPNFSMQRTFFLVLPQTSFRPFAVVKLLEHLQGIG